MEMAIILPVFLMIFFGMVTFSIALYNKTILTIATREGARAGAIADNTDAAKSIADSIAASFCNDNLIFFDTPAVNIKVNEESPYLHVTACMDSPVYFILGASKLTLSASNLMRIEK
nr:TadE family protein [Prosthecochloris sp. CIB 2401]